MRKFAPCLALAAALASAGPAFAKHPLQDVKAIRCQGAPSEFSLILEQTGVADAGFVFRVIQVWSDIKGYATYEALSGIGQWSNGVEEYDWMYFYGFRAPIGDGSRDGLPNYFRESLLTENKHLLIALTSRNEATRGPGIVVSPESEHVAQTRTLLQDPEAKSKDRLNCQIERISE